MNTLSGSIVALVTPFNDDTEQTINFQQLEKLVAYHAENGTAAIVPCGTTGESPTLTPEEHIEVIRCVVNATKGTGLQVIAGTGSNATQEAMHFTQEAKEAGADACLIVVPYYNKPTPEGLLAHFKALDTLDIPLILYNIPGRTGINVIPTDIVSIAQACKNLVGLKASNGDLDQITESVYLSQSLSKPFSVLSGDDSITLPIMAAGGTGVISVVANLMPKVMSQLVNRFAQQQVEEAQQLNWAIHAFCKSLLSFGANPMGIKAAMNKAGLTVGGCRLPLTRLTEDKTTQLIKIAGSMRHQLQSLDMAYDAYLDELVK
jgi:4-hydroxy-tetrahydrodipicolinate synthase